MLNLLKSVSMELRADGTEIIQVIFTYVIIYTCSTPKKKLDEMQKQGEAT